MSVDDCPAGMHCWRKPSDAEPAMWFRIRPDEGDWDAEIWWPHWADEAELNQLLVWNPCDGYHVWWRYAAQCPPGTHVSIPPAPPPDPEYKRSSPLIGRAAS